MEGIVIKSTGSWSTIRLEDGRSIPCKIRGQFRIRGLRSTNPVAIGDRVTVELSGASDTSFITHIHDRTNYIIRKAIRLSKVTHILAANLDHAYLIATLAFPRTSVGFIDRFLVTAAGYYIPASLIFNKIDVYNDQLAEEERILKEVYQQAGYSCYSVSALRGDGIPELRRLLEGKTSLFSGHSGAGKSALIQALDPSLTLRTGEISAYHGKGMHTTTFAEMHSLTSGGFVIDTPGIKEFGLIDFEKTEIPRCFPEMDRLLPHCQYNNCTHTHEPGCAVKAGLETGAVSRIRYNSYLSILND